MKKKHPRPPFLQDFCKNAQWRAKKLRERGSSTARPTEKGGGGLPIGSRFGRFRRVASCRFGRFRRVDSVDFGVLLVSCRVDSVGRVASIRSVASRFADFLLAFRPDSVAIRSIRSCCVASRFGRSVRSCRVASKSRRKHKKSPIPQSGNRVQLSQGVARS